MEELELRPPQDRGAGRARSSCARTIRTSEPAMPTASRTAISCGRCAASSRSHPTSSRCPSPSRTSRRSSTGAAASRIAVVPYGGGSSVVGGVEPDVGDGFAGVVSLDLRRLGRVLQVDERSRAAEVEARRARPLARGSNCSRTASRSGTSRSRSSSRRSAAGSPRAPAATTPPGPTHVDEQVEALTGA